MIVKGLVKIFSIISLAVLAFLTPPDLYAGTKIDKQFNHMLTGFPLTGAHRFTGCETCHTRGLFAGTPSQCGICHTTGSIIAAAEGKPQNHIQSNNYCDDCHTASSWIPARFDHGGVTGSCVSCHNGFTAPGKLANHVRSSNNCEDCHSATAWVPAGMDHSNIAGNCFSCHNGVNATGKSANHVQSSNNCENCHKTRFWRPASFNHDNVAPGTCTRCHINDKPATHIPTTGQCDTCHVTRAWIPASFDHQNVTQACSSCHQKSRTHFITAEPCENCHLNTTWRISNYNHGSTNYLGQHQTPLLCSDCHTSGYASFIWRYPAYKPDCASCHQDDYKMDKHKKTESPKTFYTVSELRDCTGSCHFTDGGGNQKLRNNKHSLGKTGW